MGKASSAKKVARAARAGGSRRAGQRRALGFPMAVGGVLLIGLLLVIFARNERNANARPRVNTGAAGVSGDHWHEPYSIYTCVTDPSTPADQSATTTTLPAATGSTGSSSAGSSSSSSSSQAGLGVADGHLTAAQTPTTAATTTTTATTVPTTDTTATTAPESATPPESTTSTTIAAPGDVPGEFQPPLQDAQQDVLGIHTHGDGVMHIHPFAESVSGRRATLDKFLNQVGAHITNDTLTLPTPAGGQLVYKEGTTKCLGGRDAVLKVARWDTAAAASRGDKPNEIITSNFGSIRLKNGEAMSISFLPEGSTIPIQKDVEKRLEQLTDIAPNTTTTNPQSQSGSGSSSSAPASGSSASTASTSSSTGGSVPPEPTSSSP